MGFRCKITILFMLLTMAWPSCASSFIQSIKNLFSINISQDILSDINKDMVGTIKAGNIKFIIPNQVSLEDVEVLDEYNKRVLYGKKIELSISLISLLTKNITVNDLTVVEPCFNYQISKSIHNIIRVFERKTPDREKESNMRVTIAHVVVKNGSFHMHHDAGVDIDANSINAEGMFWVEQGPFGITLDKVFINEGAIKVAGMNLPITDLKTEDLFISNKMVRTKGLSAFYEKALLKGSGTVFIDKEYYDIDASLDAPKNTYPQGLTPLPFIAPSFNAQVKMSGPLSDPNFALSMDTKSTEFRRLVLDKGHIKALINSHRIAIESAAFLVGKKGQLVAEGLVDIDNDKFSFSTSETNILSSDLNNFLDLDLKTRGYIDAKTILSGDLATKDKDSHFSLKTKGGIRNGEIDAIKLSNKTLFDVDLDFSIPGPIRIKRALVRDQSGLRLFLDGFIDTGRNAHIINYNLALPSVKRYVVALDKPLDFNHLVTKGRFAYQQNIWTASGDLKAQSLIYDDYKTDDISFFYKANAGELVFSALKAKAYNGDIQGTLRIKQPLKEKNINGNLDINGVSLPDFKNADIPFSGKVFGQVDISGRATDPKVNFNLDVKNLTVDKVEIHNTHVIGSYFANKISLDELSSIDKSGSLTGKELSFDFKEDKISGTFLLSDASIAAMLSKYFEHLDGIISGPIYLDGSLSEPQITAPLLARNMTIYGQKLGSGPLSLSLKKERLISSNDILDLVLSLSAAFKEGGGESIFRFAYALSKKTLQAHVELDGLKIDSRIIPDVKLDMGLKGKLFGVIDAKGPLERLNIDTNLIMSKFAFINPKERVQSLIKEEGSLELKMLLNEGILDLDLITKTANNCLKDSSMPKSGIKLSLNGPFDFTSFELSAHGTIDHDHIENILPSLRKELAIVSAGLSFDAEIKKARDKDITYEAKLFLERLLVNMPTIPKIELIKPVSLKISKDNISIIDEAYLSFSPGELVVSGSAGKKLNLELKGAIPLVIARFFVPIIQRADGLANGNIRIGGSKNKPLLDGNIKPVPGSTITFSKYLENLEVKTGEVLFSQSSNRSYRLELRDLKLGVGDGRFFANGVLEKFYGNKKSPPRTVFDIQMEGSNILIRDGNQFVEVDFKIKTEKQDEKESALKGSIVVTDGWFERQFDLRNFVAQVKGGSKDYSLKFLDLFSVTTDLEISVRQFRASARMLNIDLETNLEGQLRMHGPLNHPKIGGSLSVSEGKFVFPAATFDLYESRIDLDENSDKLFDPKISLVSSYELEKYDYPELSRDTTIELEISGSLDRLTINLKPVRGDLKLSPTKIFLMLLIPRTLGGKDSNTQLESIREGAQNAALAFSGEVFLRPLTNELQELLEGTTKTRIQFGSALEPGGVTLRLSWKIGPRIEAQGSYLFVSDNRSLVRERSAFFIDSYPLGDLKLKLLLFDHKPWGPLFFEGSFGANRLVIGGYEARSSLRLNYRVFSR